MSNTTDSTDFTQTSVEANSTHRVFTKSPVERLKESSKSPDPRSLDDKCDILPSPCRLLRQKRYFPWFDNLSKITGLPKNLEYLNYRRLAEYIDSHPEHEKTTFPDLCSIMGIVVSPLEPDEKRMNYSDWPQEFTLTPIKDMYTDTHYFPDVFSRPPSRTVETD